MEISFNEEVFKDLEKAGEYYEREASSKIGAAFGAEFWRSVNEAAARPLSFPKYDQHRRRANLRRFPYHILYRVGGDSVRVLILKHNKRHPSYGSRRR
jgi:toxin ParE1/3/4